jgi:N6-L-threonylcarbamoyladenine synthase
MLILGLETSCDETAAAIIKGEGDNVEVLSNIVSSQIDIHKQYGGVVPEVAAREHIKNIIPVVDQALRKAGARGSSVIVNKKKSFLQIDKCDAKGKKIDAIAVTVGPGLVTSLLVGVETAKALALAWELPLVAVNHIEGHIYANFISVDPKSKILNPKQVQSYNFKNLGSQGSYIQFPAIILTVSGGHTMLVLMKGHGRLEVIGDTLDDAAGETFDKAAAMLGLGYPGGPAVSAAAEKFPISNFQFPIKSQIPNPKSQIKLPRPMINSKDFNFSFSGLKTALLYDIKKNPNSKFQISNYAYEFQQAVIDVLISKTIKAAKKHDVKTIMLAGGVSANLELRKQMERASSFKLQASSFKLPDLKYTTDNAAMIAAAGYFKAKRKKFTPLSKALASSNYDL